MTARLTGLAISAVRPGRAHELDQPEGSLSAEIQQLDGVSHIDGPRVLVGHSYGGVLAPSRTPGPIGTGRGLSAAGPRRARGIHADVDADGKVGVVQRGAQSLLKRRHAPSGQTGAAPSGDDRLWDTQGQDEEIIAALPPELAEHMSDPPIARAQFDKHPSGHLRRGARERRGLDMPTSRWGSWWADSVRGVANKRSGRRSAWQLQPSARRQNSPNSTGPTSSCWTVPTK